MDREKSRNLILDLSRKYSHAGFYFPTAPSRSSRAKWLCKPRRLRSGTHNRAEREGVRPARCCPLWLNKVSRAALEAAAGADKSPVSPTHPLCRAGSGSRQKGVSGGQVRDMRPLSRQSCQAGQRRF